MSGRQRLPAGEPRKASQRRTRRVAPLQARISRVWRPGDQVQRARISLSAIPHSQQPPASLSQRRSDLVLGTSLATLTQRLAATASPETGYWNMARQRYCPGLAGCWRALRLSADRAGNAAQKPARKAGVLAHEDKVPRETDSPLEGKGLEPPVPLVNESVPCGRREMP
jgi:hypothetical protein